jgi:hypothetical protein
MIGAAVAVLALLAIVILVMMNRGGSETADAPAPAARLAALEVVSEPVDAAVWIDGARRAEAAGATFDSLAPGAHVVRVEKDGFAPQEMSVRLEPGATQRLAFTLEPIAAPAPPATPAPPANGTIAIRVNPFASYYVNGQLKASNVATARLSVPAGTHRVRAVHPAFDPKEWPAVAVQGGKTTTLRHDFLASLPGRIRVTSGGIWGRVYIDGRDTGKTTPCVLEGVSSGEHRVRIEREGFTAVPGEKQVTVKPGEDAYVGFELTQGR